MPAIDATSASILIPQGLRHRLCRAANMDSCAFSISLVVCTPFAVGIKPRGEGGVVRVGEGGFSVVPFRSSRVFQLMLVERRLIEEEGRGLVLLRWWCSGLVGD